MHIRPTAIREMSPWQSLLVFQDGEGKGRTSIYKGPWLDVLRWVLQGGKWLELNLFYDIFIVIGRHWEEKVLN